MNFKNFKIRYVLLAVASCVVCGAARTFTDKEIAKILSDKEKCIQETGVDSAVFTLINNYQPFTVTPELKCFWKCILEANNVMKPDGSIDLDDPNDNKEIKACKKLRDEKGDKCETASTIMICLHKNKLLPILEL